MFRDIYKAANDDIKADDELLQKVLKRKRRKIPPIYKYSSIAAAFAALAVSIAVVPSLMDKDTSGILYEESIAGTPAPVSESRALPVAASATARPEPPSAPAKQSDENSKAGQSEKSAKADSAAGDTKASRNSAVSSQKSAAGADSSRETSLASVSERAPESSAGDETPRISGNTVNEAKTENITDESETGNDAPISANDNTDEAAEARIETAAESKKKVNTYTRSAVLHVNSEDYGGIYTAESGYAGYAAGESYAAAEWSIDDYFEYLGENIFAKLSLPADFGYIGGYEMTVSVDENNQPVQDSRIFPYEGDGGRYITVITSKDTLAARSYLEDERYIKSDIEGTSAVVTGGGENYKCYMIGNGISYIITANGVTEDELAELLISIGG